jgi:hypothetical protein
MAESSSSPTICYFTAGYNCETGDIADGIMGGNQFRCTDQPQDGYILDDFNVGVPGDFPHPDDGPLPDPLPWDCFITYYQIGTCDEIGDFCAGLPVESFDTEWDTLCNCNPDCQVV